MLTLKDLRIERQLWGDNEGQFKGKIIFDGDGMEISTYLTPEQCDQIFVIVAESLANVAATAGNAMTSNIIQQQRQLEHTKNETIL